MKKLIYIFLITFCTKNAFCQTQISGIGFWVQGIERINEKELESYYFLYIPSNEKEVAIWDSVYNLVLNKNIHRYINGKENDSFVLNAIKTTTKYPFLWHPTIKDQLKTSDKMIRENIKVFDEKGCANSRSNRPFSLMTPCDSFKKIKYEFMIDKISFSGMLVNIDSSKEYMKLMSWRQDDINDRLGVSAMCHLTAGLSHEYYKFKNNFLVFIPQKIKIYDKIYSKLFPDCFFDSDK